VAALQEKPFKPINPGFGIHCFVAPLPAQKTAVRWDSAASYRCSSRETCLPNSRMLIALLSQGLFQGLNALRQVFDLNRFHSEFEDHLGRSDARGGRGLSVQLSLRKEAN
jgi:hypothetical protein